MIEYMTRYLIEKRLDNGYLDKAVGRGGEIKEYGHNEQHAIERAIAKHGGTAANYRVVGAIG